MSRRFTGRARRVEGEEESVWISFADLMTALLTVFMLAAVALVFSLTQEQSALADAQKDAAAAKARNKAFDQVLGSLGTSEQVRGAMVAQMRDRLAAQGIQVETDPTSSVLRVPTDLLGFDSGSADIRPEHEANALAIGQVVNDVLHEGDQYLQLDTVFVEGHTDDVPIGGVYGGNWGLSANRAISLWRLWEDKLPGDLGTLNGHTGERLFSVSGYADTRPVVPVQVTPEDRAANRRIDIRFTEHRLSDEEIGQIRTAAGVGS